MRSKYFGLAMAAIATLGPTQAFGGDREIAQAIMARLKTARDAGELKNFNLDMKVDEGVVLFRGSVDGAAQRAVVLAASEDIEGIREVVDELTLPKATLVKPKSTAVNVPVAKTAIESAESFDFGKALSTPPAKPAATPAKIASVPAPVTISATTIATTRVGSPKPAPAAVEQGLVVPTAAFEQPVTEATGVGYTSADDQQLTQKVVGALSKAKSMGHLKSFGVDVNSYDGIIELVGKASSDQQRQLIGQIAGGAPGARGVRNLIEVEAPVAAPAIAATPVTHRQPTAKLPQPAPIPLTDSGQVPQPMPARAVSPAPARMAAYNQGYGGGQMINGEMVVPGSMVNHGAVDVGGGQMMGAPMMGTPVPMAPAAPAGAPRYDSPNLPNYAWPGYAAYPNYAALSYPQQYSPSAFPYIGPFYPYPQVPLGWRKVSLEWDDGWWFLDFTDR